jgi:hypothetical protein
VLAGLRDSPTAGSAKEVSSRELCAGGGEILVLEFAALVIDPPRILLTCDIRLRVRGLGHRAHRAAAGYFDEHVDETDRRGAHEPGPDAERIHWPGPPRCTAGMPVADEGMPHT